MLDAVSAGARAKEAEIADKVVGQKVKFKMFSVLEVFTIFDVDDEGKSFDQALV